MPKLTPDKEPYVPRTEATADSGYDKNPTKAIAVPGETDSEPVDGEHETTQEQIEHTRFLFEKALGEVALSALMNSADRKEVIDKIQGNTSLRETLKFLAVEGVGDRIESSPLLQKTVSDWLNFAVRGQEVPVDYFGEPKGEPADDEEYEEDDDEPEYDVLPSGKKQWVSPDAKAMAIAANFQANMAERGAKRETKKALRVANARANAMADYTGDRLNEELDKIDAKEKRRLHRKQLAASFGLLAVSAAFLLTKSHFGNYSLGGNGGLDASGAVPGGNNPQGGGIRIHLPLDQAPGAPKGPELIPGVPLPQNPEQMRQFFETAIDPANRPDKLGVNDFNHPIPNGNDPMAFKLALGDQLRGNSHELARYLSEAHIPGAPLESDFPNNQAGYVDAINNYADTLDKNPELHFKQFTELVKVFNDPNTKFSVRDINKSYSSDFIQNGRFGIDDYVPPSGTVTEVTFNQGTPQEIKILVRNECGQTIRELIEKHIQKSSYTPQRPAPAQAPAEQAAPQPVARQVIIEQAPPTRINVRVEHPPVGGGPQPPAVTHPEGNLEKNTAADGSNLAQYGDPLRGPGAPQNEQNVVTPSINYSPNAGHDNPGTLAPNAAPSTGLYNGGQEPQQAGLNGTPPSSPASTSSAAGNAGGSSSSSASAGENTGSVGVN